MAGPGGGDTAVDVEPGATIDRRGKDPDDVPKWLGDRYRILGVAGRGGMGAVYRAFDEALCCEVALKVIAPRIAGSSHGLALHRDEVRLAQKVTHPNVCRTYDLENLEGNWVVKMEYVAGETLAQRLTRGPLSVALAVRIARDVCAGLSAAHKQGVVHRDLKPPNIMLEAASGRTVLMDFGIARGDADEGGTPETVSGTPEYMAPEQVRGRKVDGRADLYALGCVIYEMVVGARLFPRRTPLAAALAHAGEPPPRLPGRFPEWLGRLVARLLEKDPARRPASADEVASALARPRKRWRTAAVLASLASLTILAGWLLHDAARARWAREIATPEAERLVAAEKYTDAAALVLQALAVIPGNVTLEKLWTRATFEVSVVSTPTGAEVRYRPYRSSSRSWHLLGSAPLPGMRIPRDFYVWEASRPGFQTVSWIGPSNIYGDDVYQLDFQLFPEAGIPPGMVSIDRARVRLNVYGLVDLPTVTVDDYLIDGHEVTNEEYKRFVDAGGYQRRELWKEPFVRAGSTIGWDEAIGTFRDTTGRPGPSTWELGRFPKDQGQNPVAGVSWYEAAAYATFVGKSLPTIYHWHAASQPEAAMLIAPGSNFAGTGTVPVSSEGALSGFGTYDMAGNVKEWCQNANQKGARYVLGGGFGEPSYMFIDADAQSPWTRLPNIGFRCVKLAGPVAPAAASVVVEDLRDFRAEEPVSEETFRAYLRQFLYDKTALNARVEATEETDDWTRERVSLDAAYGRERLIAYLYLPKVGRPPFQTVVFFPGDNTWFEDTFSLTAYYSDFLVQGGRALLVPVFKGTYERRDGLVARSIAPTVLWRDHMVDWSKDLGRSLDYLETRADIDSGRIAYLGFSWGGMVAPVMLAVEDRFKAAVLLSGGFYGRFLPEVDPINFASRVRIAVLMLNGRYDFALPVDTAQEPLFELLGTPVEKKKHVVYETNHAVPRKAVIRETDEWLDRYLGPVTR